MPMSHSKKALVLSLASFALLLAVPVLAQGPFGDNLLKEVGGKVYGANEPKSLPVIVGQLIKVFIGLLGIIFLLLTVYGGYLWLMARGSKEEVQKAKDTLTRAVIGLLIVLASYAIASFVVSRLAGAV